MNYTFFNRNTGQFGQLDAEGIAFHVGREGNNVRTNRFTDALKNLKVGEYFYIGRFVITRVTGGVPY